MEKTPITTSESAPSVDKKESKSKKKKAEALGAFLVEPKAEKLPEKERDSFWKKLNKPEATVPEESEADAPLEHLGEAEKQFVERELVQAETAEPDIEPIERFRELIVAEGQDSDAALETTIAELEALPDAETEQAAELEDGPTQQPEVSNEPQEFGDEEVLIGEAHEEPIVSASVTTRGSGSGAGRPPQPPAISPTGSNISPEIPSFNTVRHPAEVPGPEIIRVPNPNTGLDLLVGGVVGYLIGRRRGRIKTEKRLLPVQKKLQKEVADVRSQLSQKEATIRKLAAKKVVPPTRQRPRSEQSQTTQPEHVPQAYVNHVKNLEADVGERPVPVAAMVAERQRAEVRATAAEANALHVTREAPEQIGHMLVTAEALPKSARKEAAIHSHERVDQSATKLEKQAQPKLSVEKDVSRLNRAELLKISEKIVVDGASLRQIYETKLVGEKGLRRLVREHLKGGDIKKALRREIVEREIDFERDPYVRDRGVDHNGPTGGGKQATLQQLLRDVTVPGQEPEEEVAFLKARSAFESKVREDEKKRRKAMDAGLLTTILVLIICILALVMMHH